MSDETNKQLIFISYSSFDTVTKEFVQRHFGVLQHLGDVEIWEDSQIDLGDDWFQEIETKLETCSVAVLLISHDFLGSKFCMQKEVPVLLERRKRDGMMIAPILLSPYAW
ncbi:MAG: toll/interleukin-1 receptor domain-containing protein, partial [Geminicoccaceae bacterium]